MDPNANLEELLRLANRAAEYGNEMTPDEITRMGELVLALDGWLAAGNFLPGEWQSARPRS